MNEIRRQSRTDCDIILNKFEDGIINICRATNISLGGMRLQRTLEPFFARGETVRLEVELPGCAEPLKIAAEKVYEETDHFGVRFTNISHRHFIRLRDWLSNQSIENDLPLFH